MPTREVLLAVADAARAHELELVVLFGSRAAGRARADSDADLAVRSRSGLLSARAFLDVAGALRCVFPEAEVDLVDLRRADPLLLRHIFTGGVPLFEETGVFSAMRLHAFHRYHDYRPLLRLERRAVRRALGLDAG